MKRSARALCLAILVLPVLYGCSGSRPFWKTNASGNDAGGVAAANPSPGAKGAEPSLFARMKNTPADRSVDGPLALARLAEQRGKMVEAERLYKSILEKSPQNKTVIHRLAVIEAKKGRFQQADQYFDQALRLDPDDPAILSDAGYCQFLQHRPSQAEGLYRRALEIDAGHQSATNNLAMLLGERGDDQAALRLFRQTGTETQAQTNMGFVYSRRGDIAKAKAAYSQALTLDPKSIVAAEALVQLSKFEKRTEKTIAQSTEPAQPWAGGLASAAASASPVVEGWPAPQQATMPQRFEPERASVQAFTPASVSRPVVNQPEPAIAANTAEYVSAGRPDPAIQAAAYPDPPLARPFDSGGIQAGDWPQSGVGMESTEAAMQAIASGFHAR